MDNRFFWLGFGLGMAAGFFIATIITLLVRIL